MSSVSPLFDAKLRLEWAKNQIGEFEVAIRTYFASHPYRIVEDRDSKPGRILHRLTATEAIPGDWQKHVTRIVADLREPLDYATVAVGRKLGAEKADFLVLPIEDSEKAFEREINKRKIERRCPDLAKFLRAVKPYKGPNDLLFGLHELSRTNKHRELAPIGMAGTWIFSPGELFYAGSAGYVIGAQAWEPAKNSMVIFERASDSIFKGDLKGALHVALYKLEGFERHPVTTVFMQMANAVENVLSSFEKQFFSKP